jgi:hypothetical protein
MTGNFLKDVLENTYSIEQVKSLKNHFSKNGMIPFINLNESSEFINALFVTDSFGTKKLISEIYKEIDYPLNRGPIYYVSNYVLNYGFETYIIITQDGMICQNPENNKEVAFYAWENWKEVLYTKHKDIEGGVVLFAFPSDENGIEISLSPKLDLKLNVELGLNDNELIQNPKYTNIVEEEMNLASTIFKNLWSIVDANRGSNVNSIPLEKLFIFNVPSAIQAII